MKRPFTFTASVLTLGILGLSAEASATPTFPDVIKATLSTPNTPDCAICHIGTPGTGTVNTAFGKTMRARGLLPNNEGTLKTALQAISAEKKDSNGDGITDVDALKAGQDPNGTATADGGSSGSSTPEPIQYGCARVAPKTNDESSFAVLGLLGVACVFVLRRRTR